MRRRWGFLVVGLLLSLLLAGVASFYASGAPDGLEKVAADRGFQDTAREHPLERGPLAGYGTRGVHDARLSGGLAGVAGVAVTLVVAGGLFRLLARRRRADEPGPGPTAGASAGPES